MEDPEIESGMDNETNQFNTIEMWHGFLLEMKVFFLRFNVPLPSSLV